MSKLLIGSINLSELIQQAKAGHSAFHKSDNGKIYVNVNLWINDEKDKYGNDASIQINPAKDSKDTKVYIGNMKYAEVKNTESKVDSNDIDLLIGDSDLPF